METNDVKMSYARCLMHEDFFGLFYDIFMNSNPQVRAKFEKTDFVKQKHLIRHGINLVIMYAHGDLAGQLGLERIRKSHSKAQLDIAPQHYATWKAAFLQALRQADPKFNQALEQQWHETLDKGINFISGGYEQA